MKTFKSNNEENYLYFSIEDMEGEQVFLEVEKRLRSEVDIAIVEKETTVYLIVVKGIWKEKEFELTFDMDFHNTSLYSESAECLEHLEEILNDE